MTDNSLIWNNKFCLEVFTMHFELLPMMECELTMFKRDIQKAFQKGFEDVYGKFALCKIWYSDKRNWL